jgi:hypothetical protein
MRILSLFVLAACISNPDPRNVAQKQVLRDGHGGWIEVVHANGYTDHGELIAVTSTTLVVLTPTNEVVTDRIDTVQSAELFEYDTEHAKLGAWGGIGALSSVSHGFFAIISIPIWVATTITTEAIQSRSSRLTYPDDAWTEFAKWARFPQGLPPGITPQDLLRQDRTPKLPPEPPPPPVVDAGIDIDAAVDAP